MRGTRDCESFAARMERNENPGLDRTLAQAVPDFASLNPVYSQPFPGLQG
jgi:hypothetical protein